MGAPETILEAKSLFKKYGDQLIVHGISFEIFRGECFGILGPNGAGKSSTLKMMYGANSIDQGELYILGLNARHSMRGIKARVGVVPQEDGLETEMTTRENLEIFSKYHGILNEVSNRRIEDLLKLMRLEEHAGDLVQILSGGLRRRLAIARGMVNHPELLIMDEPTAGLDPQARFWIWNFLKQVKAEMGTIVMTTHYMEEAEQVCDRVAIMDEGRILAIDSPEKLIQEHIGKQVVEVTVPRKDIQYYSGRMSSQGFKFLTVGYHLQVHLNENEDSKKVLALVDGLRVTVRNPTLQDVFIKLAGHDLREEPL